MNRRNVIQLLRFYKWNPVWHKKTLYFIFLEIWRTGKYVYITFMLHKFVGVSGIDTISITNVGKWTKYFILMSLEDEEVKQIQEQNAF